MAEAAQSLNTWNDDLTPCGDARTAHRQFERLHDLTASVSGQRSRRAQLQSSARVNEASICSAANGFCRIGMCADALFADAWP
jgi:hypothetical protein